MKRYIKSTSTMWATEIASIADMGKVDRSLPPSVFDAITQIINMCETNMGVSLSIENAKRVRNQDAAKIELYVNLSNGSSWVGEYKIKYEPSPSDMKRMYNAVKKRIITLISSYFDANDYYSQYREHDMRSHGLDPTNDNDIVTHMCNGNTNVTFSEFVHSLLDSGEIVNTYV